MVKTVAIVSLSHGTIGEDFAKHELEIGLSRLKSYGLNVKFMNNALKGHSFLKEHPEKRAEDLLQAFMDNEVDSFAVVLNIEPVSNLHTITVNRQILML